MNRNAQRSQKKTSPHHILNETSDRTSLAVPKLRLVFSFAHEPDALLGKFGLRRYSGFMTRRVFMFLFVLVFAATALWWWHSGPASKIAEKQKSDWPLSEAQRADCRGAILGRVLDGDKRPVAGVLLRLDEAQTKSDAQGRFALRGLQQPEQQLELERAGYIVAGPPGQQSTKFILPRRDDGKLACLFDQELFVHRPAFVQGQVLKSKKAQPAELDLLVLESQGPQKKLGPYVLEQVQRTDSQGRFSFAVTPGLVQISASAEDQGEAQSDEILLGDGERLNDIVIDLDEVDVADVSGLSGEVHNEQGQALAGANITVSGQALARELHLQSDTQGRFHFADLQMDQPRAQLRVFVQARGYYSKIHNFSARSEHNKPLRIILQKAAGIFGRVLDAQGQAVAKAYVIARFGGRPKLLRSDAQGFFHWDKAPNGLGEAWALTPYAADSPRAALRPAEECLLQLGPGAALSGMVVDERGQPLKDFRVAIERVEVEGARPYRENIYPPFQSDHDAPAAQQLGAFNFASLRPGRYLLVASSSGFSPAHTDWLALHSGKTYEGMRIVLSRGAAVYGQVTNRDGDPVVGAKLALSEFRAVFRAQSVSTDAEGRYRLEHLEAGRKSLKVSARGYLTQVAAGVEVPEHGELRRDVTLARARAGADFSFAGIGAVLMLGRGGVYIRDVMPGQGAAAQGLRHGDKIVSVDGEDVDGLELDQVVSKIRGEEGEGVSLDIERPGIGPMSVDVERGQVVVERRSRKRMKR